ncbi:NYN domain-containing protein [Kyrpidia sp.]|uniref:NYN domain-containing protein n=1 Tax=Kyrpidia sp. TaxID=2073077 RepID=UPI0025860C0C|nr:NYN domain-containing protein [Kyrpidia sp.]
MQYVKANLPGINDRGEPIFEQKRVDVSLATDLVMHSTKRLITHASLLTGDSDFLPAIAIAQNEGVHVTLYYADSARPNDELLDVVDERILITKDMIDRWRRST